MFVRYILATLFAGLSFTKGLNEGPGRWGPYPICEECRSPEMMAAPGVGFDLTHSYGTAAIHFQNESVAFVGKINGNSDFELLMKRLSDRSSAPKTPNNRWDELRYRWERMKRKFNKSHGLPATEDVGTIAKVLIDLRKMVEEKLGHNITAAVTARPNLPGLTREDLEDAMEYAGMKMLRAYNYFSDVSETSAASAATGKGLCKKPEDIKACEDEEVTMPIYDILSVSFTNTILYLAYTRISSANRCYELVYTPHFNLGLQSLDIYPNAKAYWTEVNYAIRDFIDYPPRIDTVLLMGEAAPNEDFQKTLRDALEHFEPGLDVVMNISSSLEPLSLVARGAAELAKRFQVMTWNCKEPIRCREHRDTVGRPPIDL